jgi:glycogen synthase
MRILFSSHVFAPSVGGLESVSRMLAEEFVRQGHEVRLITQTVGPAESNHLFSVLRRPSARELLAQTRWCDVCFHNNISLPRAWPLLAVHRPWVIAHHVWVPRRGLAGRSKRIAMRFATGIAISKAVAADMPGVSCVIPNPYDDATFRELPHVTRDRELVFLGRLVSDKGADLLITALDELRTRGLAARLTIIGSGPEEEALRARVAALDLGHLVSFAGTRHGRELVELLNAHRLIVIPSIWQEPFGVVALEGMACGCVPLGSNGGGLGEAIGECGQTFPNGDAGALSAALGSLLLEPARQARYRAGAREHLRRHARASVAQEYLRVFASVLEASGDGRTRARNA